LRGVQLAVFVDHFPELSETFVLSEARSLAALGHEVRVEAARRAQTPNPEAEGAGLPVVHWDSRADWGALGWLAARHPLRCLRDVVLGLVRWRRDEEVRPLRRLAPVARRVVTEADDHLHAHFAAQAALDAMRVSLLTGVPYSVTTHGYDIWLHPRNLREKLTRARFHVAVSDYNRAAVAAIQPERLHTVVMGVDGERFRRRAPYPGGRTVLAVGRLVEKKGFVHLAQAARRLPDVTFRIVGEGPEHERIEAVAPPNLALVGALAPERVRAELERADLLAAPCVVAADGDRDAMPVVVKEALAMEVPVVASDEVALPEVVRPDWGRLVPPGDPAALAAAIGELLELPPGERAAMGRRGREFVLASWPLEGEARKLAELIGPG
jgi:colanic acid/amylovoran biosynthesis glycosyltransferase